MKEKPVMNLGPLREKVSRLLDSTVTMEQREAVVRVTKHLRKLDPGIPELRLKDVRVPFTPSTQPHADRVAYWRSLQAEIGALKKPDSFRYAEAVDRFLQGTQYSVSSLWTIITAPEPPLLSEKFYSKTQTRR